MRNLITKATVVKAVLLGAILSVVMAGAAFAQAVDPTGGFVEDNFDGIKSFITNFVLPGLGAVLLLAVAIRVGMKWFKRGANA